MKSLALFVLTLSTLFGQDIDYSRIRSGPGVSVVKYGAKGNGTTNDTSSIQACLTAVTSCLVPNGTYKITGTSGIILPDDGTLFGPSPLSSTTVFGYTGSGDAITNVGTADHLTIRDFSISSQTAANGISLNGSSANITNTTISGMRFQTSKFTNACIKLQNSFLVSISNIFCYPDPVTPYGIDIHASIGVGFNDTDTIENVNIAGTDQAGINCEGSCTGLKIRDSVIESNGRKGIWLRGGNPQGQIVIDNVHFEGNSLGTADYDIYINPQDSTAASNNGNWGTASIINNESNNASGLGFLYLSHMVGANVSNNHCTAGAGKITLGPSVINANIKQNGGCQLQTETGRPISDSSVQPTFDNLFTYSSDMTNGAWTVTGAGASINQSGNPRSADGTTAFNLVLGSATATTPAVVLQSYSTTVAGRLFLVCGLVRTDAGTAYAAPYLADAFMVYTQTLPALNHFGVIVGTDEQKMCFTSTTGASDPSASISAGLQGWNISGATKLIISKVQLAEGRFNSLYVSTTTATISGASSGQGHTTFAQLGTASANSQIIYCDNCTPTNPPVAGIATRSGAVAKPVNSSGSWTWSTLEAPNFILSAIGSFAAVAGTFPGAPCGVDDYPADGLIIFVQLAAAGATGLTGGAGNTMNLTNCGSGAINVPIKSALNPANNIATSVTNSGGFWLKYIRSLGASGTWLFLGQ